MDQGQGVVVKHATDLAMEASFSDETLILSYQLHRNDALDTLCFCESCKIIRKKINLLQLNDIRSFLGKAS